MGAQGPKGHGRSFQFSRKNLELFQGPVCYTLGTKAEPGHLGLKRRDWRPALTGRDGQEFKAMSNVPEPHLGNDVS